MAKKRNVKKRPAMVLFGEGETDGIFLAHLRDIVRGGHSGLRIVVAAGNGGSPDVVWLDLKKKLMSIGEYSKVLLLIDADIPLEKKLRHELEKDNVELVMSSPQCLEGLLLNILSDVTPAHKQSSAKLKGYFHKEYLKTDRDSQIAKLLKQKCPKLFPKELLEQKRSSISELDELLKFLQV